MNSPKRPNKPSSGMSRQKNSGERRNTKPAAKTTSQDNNINTKSNSKKSGKSYFKKDQYTKALGDPLPKMDAVEQRLNKFLSNAGICSRREADVLIQSGVISVNGKIITELGYKIKPGDQVQYDGETIHADKKRYILVNKPKEFVVTAEDTWGRKSIYDLIRKKVKETVYPVGLLDRDTTGLMIYTNDGDLFKKLVHPAKMALNLFHVTLNKPFDTSQLEDLKKGRWDLGKRAKVVNAEIVVNSKNFELGIEIKTDNSNAVRKIFENHGYEVVKLDRVMYAGLTKKDLPRGFFRDITPEELNYLRMY
jgi:23S rRNA pseudouridine2605 synthase